jgi:prophage endopeptidase
MTSIQRTAIAVFLTLLVVFGIYKWGYGRGWGDRDVEMQTEIAKKNEEARQTEQKLAEVVQVKETELRKANDVINKKQTDLNAAIRAGRVRLSTASCPQAPTSAPIAIRDLDQARGQPSGSPDQAAGDTAPSESERETLRLIAEIAADGDRAINQLNACITAYEEIRTTINAQQ